MEWNDESQLYGETMALKQKNPNLKVLIAVGGWTMNDVRPAAGRARSGPGCVQIDAPGLFKVADVQLGQGAYPRYKTVAFALFCFAARDAIHRPLCQLGQAWQPGGHHLKGPRLSGEVGLRRVSCLALHLRRIVWNARNANCNGKHGLLVERCALDA